MTTLTESNLPKTSPLDTDALMAKFAPLAGRILLGGVFVQAGLAKIGAYAGTQGYMEAVGLPGGLLPLVIAFEVLAGLVLIAGWKTRWAASALAGFTLMTAFLFHGDLADPMQSLFFAKNLGMAGGLLVLAGLGGGVLSFDRRSH